MSGVPDKTTDHKKTWNCYESPDSNYQLYQLFYSSFTLRHHSKLAFPKEKQTTLVKRL